MSINPLNDISRVYLEQVVESSHLETDMKTRRKNNEKAVKDMKKTKAYQDMVDAARKKFDEALDPVGQEDADVDNDGKKNTKSDKYLLKRRAAISKAITHKEALDPVGKEDDDIDNDGIPNTKSDKYLKHRRKVRGKVIAKEGFSNWREDLIEVTSKLEGKDGKEPKIVEKSVDNKININPNLDLGEAVENLGGTLLEMVEIENFEGVLDEFTESEIFLLSDQLIEQVVEEFFYECIEEGYDILEVENRLIESLEISCSILTEEESIKESRLEKIKGAVKRVGKALAHGVGYAAGAAVRGIKAAGREVKSGYERGRSGSSQGRTQTSSSSTSDGGDSGEKKPGLLSRIGSKLKRGLAKTARAVSRGARNVARRVEGGEKKATPKVAPKKAEKPEDPWSGSATTPPKAKAKTKKAAAPKAKSPTAAKPKAKRKSKLDDLLASVRSEEAQLDEIAPLVAGGLAIGGAALAGKAIADKMEQSRQKVTSPSTAKPTPSSSLSDKMRARNQQMRELMNSYELEGNQIDEKTLSDAETKKKEEIVKSMKDKASDFEKRYPGRGKEVMYATATKMAKKIAK
jgi:hypothetical protein